MFLDGNPVTKVDNFIMHQYGGKYETVRDCFTDIRDKLCPILSSESLFWEIINVLTQDINFDTQL